MREHIVNHLDNFIAGWYVNDLDICDAIVDLHKSSLKQQPGMAGMSIQPEIKNSIDVVLEYNEISMAYFDKFLDPCFNNYREKYYYANHYSAVHVKQAINIQYYPPGGGYYAWHTERTHSAEPMGSRHLAFMTYLNDVVDDGETEWFHQKLKIKPEKGLTLIWPVDWTFTHRGIPSTTQEKYIVTGWFNNVYE
jgi:hypothetical protein